MQSLVLSLTLFRILAAPFVFISVVFLENYWLSFWLFNLAALTDFLDGKIARDYEVESKLGAILDPIGDKLLLLFALLSIMLVTQNAYVGFMAALILGREFWVSALREFTSEYAIADSTKVTLLAKVKTAIQFISISMFLLGFGIGNALLVFLANFTLFFSLLISLKSAINYTLNVFGKTKKM
jgi:CDP-diacylglycerol--glycerol-3-phosphate 3-phosphatidyltransferase